MANFYASYPFIAGSGGGGGGVSSVGLADTSTDPIFNITNSPVTSSGVIDMTLVSQDANTVFAGPASGSADQPNFRALVTADLPSGTGTVTSVSVASANGFSGTVATATTTPAITLSTSISGLLQGSAGALAAYIGGSLVEATSSVLTITGGANSQIGLGTSIQVKQASTSQSGYLSNTDWDTFNGKQASGNYLTALTGDGTASGPGSAALTLATVNSNTGGFGSSTAIPNFTVNGKGLITAAGTNVVIAPAGTLTGTTLASNVVTSSLTSVGTLTSGTWNATTITAAHGGTGLTSPGTSGNVLTSNGSAWVSQASSGGSPVAPTIQQFTSGSGTYTTPTSPAPLYIRAVIVGGGGGGNGGGSTIGTGGVGGNTTFGTSLLVANGGGVGGGSFGSATTASGGTASLGSGPIGIALAGSDGSCGSFGVTSVAQGSGGEGGTSALGGGGGGGGNNTAGSPGVTNSGSGGGGGGGGGGGINAGGTGGASGGYIDAIITSPSATYAYGVGAAGTAGAAGTGGLAGAAGGSGLITVYEYYQ